jgi:DnaK suppressor protein
MTVDTKYFKEFFEKKHKDIVAASKARSLDEVDSGGDDADIVCNNMIKNLSDQLSARDKLAINKIMGALSRIESNTFGICEDCEEEIGEKRLKALPDCSLCISCAEMQELKIKTGAVDIEDE